MTNNIHFNIQNEIIYNFQDSGNALPSKIKVKIEASHAGVINGNNVFYTPKALRIGAKTLLEPFNKHLQEKHYSKALGPIHNAYYESTDKSIELKKIEEATSPTNLVAAVTSYLKSDTYKKNSTKGFGALFIEGSIFKQKKIKEIQDSKKGFVSIAGDSNSAFCSICAKAPSECSHIPGKIYNNRKAFIIFDSASLDHVSFEEVPADWETNTQIIEDSAKEIFSLEILDNNNTEKGQNRLMNQKIEDLKLKLSDLSKIYQDYSITAPSTEITDSQTSEYLFPEDKTLALVNKENIYIARKVLEEIEDSVEKEYLVSKVEEQYKKYVGEISLEELEKQVVVQDSQVEDEPSITELTSITKEDLENFLSSITNTIKSSLDIKDSQDTLKSNSVLLNEIKALKADKIALTQSIDSLTVELKDSLLVQLENKVTPAYFEKIKDKSLKELKIAFEIVDSLAAEAVVEATEEVSKIVEPEIQDSIKEPEQVQVADALQTMEESKIETPDVDQNVQTILDELKKDIYTQKELSSIYKEQAKLHGFSKAKQVIEAIKKTKTIK